MISATSAVPTSGAAEATITFYNEPWTVEVARLLLEVDEGWVGYRHDTVWSWHEETYKVFTSICCDRKWPCNSKAACIAMLQAIRTGVISMKFSNATRSSDGYAQWSLIEMRELGAQMRRVVDNESRTICWTAQLETFVQNMTSKDTKYILDDRTMEDFATRASKFVPETLALVDSDLPNRTVTPENTQRKRRQAMDDAINSADDPLLSGKNINTKTTLAARKRVRSKNVGKLGDEDVSWRDNTSLQRGSATQELYDGLLHLPLENGPLQQQSMLLLTKTPPHRRQAPPHQGSTSMRESPYQIEWAPTSPRQYSADQAQSVNGIQDSAAATQQPTRKYRRVQQSSIHDRETVNSRTSSTKANAPSYFRNLNPYDRPGKLWGEFVVDVLLAERTASNEDELDYVQFVRNLYEI
ncbi:unnamed protein product [Peronospora destructor]|uniref:Uncharacterized protein n=1 Tax=Peronospora destructor TaxID=86335 RepID=A0AAV0V8E5_9STRA|nr:unnamed protein product [Peronospora destructor]